MNAFSQTDTTPLPISIRAFLKKTLQGQSDISKLVAADALEKSDPITYLEDVVSFGCVSGIVRDLIYYDQTAEFFDRHYQEIEMIRFNWESLTSEAIPINGDLKNSFSWFAYEATAQKLLIEVKRN